MTAGIIRVSRHGSAAAEDMLAVEEPLEIQLLYHTPQPVLRKVSVTMRTPGRDAELATGFLFTEGILQHATQIASVILPELNTVQVTLAPGVLPNLQQAERNFYTTSSCGVCGKSSIEAIRTVAVYPAQPDNLRIPATLLYTLPEQLRAQQDVFESTGGLHASALFDLEGRLLELREDVGRHNALDKIIGAAFMRQHLPLEQAILLLSGRASFELVQKAAMAGIRIIAAVGAPSSLAVSLAAEQGITLVGFLRAERFNIYSGDQRIVFTN
ncbi:formate dehydrogenase accessory sulfurtransferase FdhD [Taibaiella koreensis]|uniref:formate dehydrogenase accessory sulfurtransferase FdhD n=1 Tax=Taibaiella koreensis TaxID=1268548 RepID=UPI001F098245|nr:formate dehydrogenase accessory sulfurtransferase FdhD [Taibaiella koreensis]